MQTARERFARIADSYDRGAAAYAQMGEASGRDWFAEPQRRLRELLPPGARVLDIGCGPGLEMADLRELDLDPVGLDVSRGQLQIARKRLPSAALIQGTALTLPFRAGTFDGVWASASLLHLAREDAARGLAEIRRVLVDDGAFYCSIQRGSGEGWTRGDGVGAEVWYTFFGEEEWRGLLAAAGFSIRWFLASEEGTLQKGASGWINALAVAE